MLAQPIKALFKPLDTAAQSTNFAGSIPRAKRTTLRRSRVLTETSLTTANALSRAAMSNGFVLWGLSVMTGAR
jgi:hypothetical protein